jgi:uncharacterized membrane protein
MHGHTHNHPATAATAGQERPHGDGHGTEALNHTRGVPSTAAIAGHPIHPALVVFPIGLLVGAFGADLGFWWTDDSFWARASLWLTGTGMALGAVAAVAGLVDFLTIDRARVHRAGWVHTLSAGLVLVLAAASWLLRLGNPVAAVLPWGLVLSAINAGLLVVVGWVGGELAYRHMIGVTGHGGHDDDHGQERAESMPANAHDQPSMATPTPSGADDGSRTDHPGMDHAAMGHARAQQGERSKTTPDHAAMGHPGAQPDGRSQGAPDHAAMGHAGMSMGKSPASQVTAAQIAAVTIFSLLSLAAGIIFSMSYANPTLSARDVGGAVMPPGMIQTRDLSGAAMRDMAAVDLRHLAFTAPADARGDQPLEPRVEDGVKAFDLNVSAIRWNILSYARTAAYAFNGQVPGPRIHVTEGDRVRLNVTNNLPEPTTVHWHGLILPNAMDGPSEITQEPIPPGGTYTHRSLIFRGGWRERPLRRE